MTDDEDRINWGLNKQINACTHSRIQSNNGRLTCPDCPAGFAVVMKPRKARPFTIDVDDFPCADKS